MRRRRDRDTCALADVSAAVATLDRSTRTLEATTARIDARLDEAAATPNVPRMRHGNRDNRPHDSD